MIGGIICQTNLVESKIDNLLLKMGIKYNSAKTKSCKKISYLIEECKQKGVIDNQEETILNEWRKYRNIAAHCVIGYDKNTGTPLLLYKNKISITKDVFKIFNDETDVVISIIAKLENIS